MSDLSPIEQTAFTAIHSTLCSPTCTDGGSTMGPYARAARAAVAAIEPLIRAQVAKDTADLLVDSPRLACPWTVGEAVTIAREHAKDNPDG